MAKYIIKLIFICLTLSACSHLKNERLPASAHRDCFESMSYFFSYSPYYNYNAPNSPLQINLSGRNTLEELEEAYGGWSYFSVQSQFPKEKIIENNRQLTEVLRGEFNIPEANGKVTSLTYEESKEVYTSMKENQVVRCDLSYERPGTSIGFCFGRATIAHMEALRMGVHPQAIRKIWGVGDMGHWGHHVATIVKTDDGWMVLDNVIGFLKVEDWMTKMSSQAQGNKPVMFFVSNAERFGPASNSGYSPNDLFGSAGNDYYNGFFRDYFDWLNDQPPVTPFAERR